MDIDGLKRTFFMECEELLAASEENLDSLRSGAEPLEAVNALFRNVHSIKGGARAFDLEQLGTFAHIFETFMAGLRKDEGVVSPETLGLLFDSVDILAELVHAAQEGGSVNSAQYDRTLAALQDQSDPPESAHPDEYDDFTPIAVFDETDGEDGADTTRYQIHFVPGPRMLSAGVDPLMVIRAFKSLGSVTITCDLSNLPSLADLDPHQCALAWHLTLDTAEPRLLIDDIAEMVDDLGDLTIELVEPEPLMPGPLMPEPLMIEAAPMDEVAPTALPAPAPPRALDPPKEPSSDAAPVKAEPKADGPAVKNLQAKSAAPPTIRVEVPKLERLGNMVGELVITQAFLMRQAEVLSFEKFPELFRALEEMSQHIRDLQDSSLALRAQPLKTVFSRFGALLRDLERTTGKSINLTTSGEDTEIDKTVVERLNEPLTHLIRNAVDHGIENAATRMAAGKDPQGRIHLSAEQRGSQVIIELSDDGGGINRAVVRAKAIERGLISAEAILSDEEIDDLIFLPGFSTKDVVSEISGRGVGMDAVRQSIVDLGGRVFVRSVPGRGSSFILTLPLSLAVLDAMITIVGGQRFLIPVHNVRRTIRPTHAQIMAIERRNPMVSVNGELLRIVKVAEEFGVPDAVTDPTRGLLVIVDGTYDQQGLALLVDDLWGQEPVVVKSLERNFRKVPGVAAATILGDGRAALILDLLTLGANGGRRLGNAPTAALAASAE